MMNPPIRSRHALPAAIRRGALLLGAAVLGALAAMSTESRAQQTGQAQLTTQTLIGDAVTEIGARYSEVDQAIQRFNNRDVLAARQFLEAAKKKDPSLPPTDLMLAKMYFLTGNAQGGRAALEKTALEHPEDPEVYLILADQSIAQGRSIEAEALYDKALSLIEGFDSNAKRKRNFQIRARAGRATVYERRRDWPDAARELTEWLKVDPESASAHYRLGRALFMQKNYKEGYEEFVAADKRDENLPDPWVSVALMYDQLGQDEEAQKAFERAMKEKPDDVAALTAYSQWLIKNGSIERAETVLADARKLHPENLNLLILSGVAARMAKKMKPAEDYFMEALRISPANGDTLNQLALLLIEQGDQAKRQRALEFAGISSRLNNESADAQVTLAWVLYQLGRANEAEQALRAALQLGNLSPDSSYLVAKVLVEQNRAEPARQILQQALDAEAPGIFVNRQDAQSLLGSLENR